MMNNSWIRTMSIKDTTNKEVLVFILGLLLILPTLKAQDLETNQQSRAAVEFKYKLWDQLKLSLSPEFRFDEDRDLDDYVIEGGTAFKVSDHLSLGATYRFYANLRKTKDTEYFNRYAISGTLEKEYNRFKPSLKIQYSNYTGESISDESYMRYKTIVKYDIRKSKITPLAGFEVFQQLSDYQLHKLRYITGLNYKLFKSNFLGVSYKLDSFSNENKNNHILSLTYKIKL